jgi:hypothetical protein
MDVITSFDQVIGTMIQVADPLSNGDYYTCVEASNEAGQRNATNNGLGFFVEVVLPPHHDVFVTSLLSGLDGSLQTPIPDYPKFGTLAGADWVCNQAAFDAGRNPEWDGTTLVWTAVASTLGVDANFHVVITGPVYNTKRELIANDATEFFSGAIQTPVLHNEYVDQVTTDTQVWTGSDQLGREIGGQTCAAWNSTSSSDIGAVGDASAQDANWLSAGAQECTAKARLYCISPLISD